MCVWKGKWEGPCVPLSTGKTAPPRKGKEREGEFRLSRLGIGGLERVQLFEGAAVWSAPGRWGLIDSISHTGYGYLATITFM